MLLQYILVICYLQAPEIMSKTPSHGPAADVWSFGLTLLAVILGEYPLLKSTEKMNYWNLVKVICDEPHPEIGDMFSAHTRSFINACLFKDPAERGCVQSLLCHDFVANGDIPSSELPSSVKSNSGVSHKQLSTTIKRTLSSPSSATFVESADVILMKYQHLETILEHVDMKYAMMVEVWKKQDSSKRAVSSFRSISARAESVSRNNPAEPMTRLPNFVSGLEQWKHLACQLHIPLDVVKATASRIINPKYFAR